MSLVTGGSGIDLDGLLALEKAVWEALRLGDAAADAALLSRDYLGVYETGFGDRDEHVAQLADGPTVAAWRIDAARMLHLADGVALLAYRATYRRIGSGQDETMYVSSVWRREGQGWRNLYSQDTAAGAMRPV